MTPVIIFIFLLVQVLFGAVGLVVWTRSKNQKEMCQDDGQRMTVGQAKEDSVRCQQLLTDIRGTLSTHNSFLEHIRDEVSIDGCLAAPLPTSHPSHLGHQLNAQVDELGELLEGYDSVMHHERLKLRDYAREADDVDRILSDIASDSAAGFEPFSDIVRKMLTENLQLRATVQSCQSQISELLVRAIRSDRDARVDALTKLPNRRAWSERCEALGEEESDYSIAVMDIDDFKKINDNYGHAAGDAVLTTVARILREDVHSAAFRIGGDEFIILMKGTKLDEATRRLDSVRRRISKAVVNFQQHRVAVTVTFGIAEVDQDEAVTEVINRADSALYCAKNSGKNCIHASGA